MLLPHRELAVAMVLRATGDPAEAEDCVHDAMVRLVRRDDLDPGRVRSLLVRAALHIAIDHRRAAGRRRSAVLRLGGGAAAEVTSPEQVLAERAEAERLLAAVDRLPRREREVMLLRLAGLTVAEAARRLGISVKSVEGAYTRARARVRLLLGGMLAWVLDRIRRSASRGETAVAAGAMVAVATTTVAALVIFDNPAWIGTVGRAPARLLPPDHVVALGPPPPPHADIGPAAGPAAHGGSGGIGAPPPRDALLKVPFVHSNPPTGKPHNPPPDCQVCVPIDTPGGIVSTGIYVTGIDTDPQDNVDAWTSCVDQLHPETPDDPC